MKSNELIYWINKYKESHPLAGLSILNKINKIMPSDCDTLKDGNCCTFRELVTGLLFN